jgi:hypothetical protein
MKFFPLKIRRTIFKFLFRLKFKILFILDLKIGVPNIFKLLKMLHQITKFAKNIAFYYKFKENKNDKLFYSF